MILTVLHFSFPSAPRPVNATSLATCTSLQSPNADRNATDSSCPLCAPITQPRLLHVTETYCRVKHPAVQKGLPKEEKKISFLPFFTFFWLDTPQGLLRCSLVFSPLSPLDGCMSNPAQARNTCQNTENPTFDTRNHCHFPQCQL